MTEKSKYRDGAGRFKVGNPGNPNSRGRPKGSRHKLSERFLADLAGDFERHGLKVIEQVRHEDPVTYLRVVASVIPKDVELSGPNGQPLSINIVRFSDIPAEQMEAEALSGPTLVLPGAGRA